MTKQQQQIFEEYFKQILRNQEKLMSSLYTAAFQADSYQREVLGNNLSVMDRENRSLMKTIAMIGE